ncbi:MAG: PAS domain-containing protein [Alphaproteobacteria bacterium]|nr:PAS domain-containing protein [Alphaproteobacteria bacterium]
MKARFEWPIGKLAVGIPAALILLILGLVGYSIHAEYRRSAEKAFADAATIANLIAEYTGGVLDTADQAIAGIAGRIDVTRLRDDSYSDAAHDILTSPLVMSQGVYAYYILDADGISRLSSRAPREAPVDFSDSPAFLALKRNPDQGLFISDPIRGRAGPARDRWVLQIGRALKNADGSLVGIVAAAISIESLHETFSLVRIGPGSLITLIHDDGHIVVTSPYNEARIGYDLNNEPEYRAHRPLQQTGAFISKTEIEGATRLSAYRKVPDRPFLIYVGFSADDVFAPWRASAIREAALAGVLILAVILFAVVLARSAGRWRAEVLKNRERLNRMVGASGELILIRDLDTLLRSTARLCRDLVGSHLCAVSLVVDGIPTRHVTDMSDKYAAWRHYSTRPTGAGIYRLISAENRPLRLTQRELESHPGWRGFGDQAGVHPPLRGWLAVPLIGSGGGNLGVIQLSDKFAGEFSASDEAVLMQIGQVAAAAVQGIHLLEAVDQTRQAAERTALEAEQARTEIESIFRSMSDAFFSVDHDFRITYLNPRAEVFLAKTTEELVGRNLWEAFPEARETVLWKEYHDVMQSRKTAELTMHYEPLRKWFEIRAQPHKGGMSVYFRDVTERHLVEEQLREAQKMEAIGQLTGGVAHDFNTLLTVILGNTDTLVNRLADEHLRRLAELVQAAAEKAADLTQSLLAFARRQVLTPEPVDVARKLKLLSPLLLSVLEPAMKLEVTSDPDLPLALVDRQQFDTAVLNLVINARDAMRSHGRITVTAKRAHLGRRQLGPNSDIAPGNYVAIEVRDTGSGMSPEVLQRAFEPFFTTKEVGKGTGLGLSMVYGFIKQSRGHVSIHSALDAGTTVTLYLPCADVPATPKARDTDRRG